MGYVTITKNTSVVLIRVVAHRAKGRQAQVTEESCSHSYWALSPHDDHTDELPESFRVAVPLTIVSGLAHIHSLQKSIGCFRGSRSTLQQFSDLIFFVVSGLIDEQGKSGISNGK